LKNGGQHVVDEENNLKKKKNKIKGLHFENYLPDKKEIKKRNHNQLTFNLI
jgi:hypothetical protein